MPFRKYELNRYLWETIFALQNRDFSNSPFSIPNWPFIKHPNKTQNYQTHPQIPQVQCSGDRWGTPFLLFIPPALSDAGEKIGRKGDRGTETLLRFFFTNSVVAVQASALQLKAPPVELEPDEVRRETGESRTDSGVIWRSSSSEKASPRALSGNGRNSKLWRCFVALPLTFIVWWTCNSENWWNQRYPDGENEG